MLLRCTVIRLNISLDKITNNYQIKDNHDLNLEWIIWRILLYFIFFLPASLYNLAMNPTRCTILFNTFIYFSSLHVSGVHAPIIRRKLLYICGSGTCHFVWVSSGWIETVVSIQPADQTPLIEWQVPVAHRYNNFPLMMGAWTPENM